MKNRFFVHILSLFTCFVSFSQSTDEQLAIYYFNEGDCEKALPYLEKVYQENPGQFIFDRYLECTRKEGSEKDVIKLIEKQIDKFPYNYQYKILLGREYEAQNDQRKADKIYSELIENLSPNSRDIIELQKAFLQVGKNQLALQTLQKGQSLMKGNYPFNIQFAEVYGAMGETEKMIDEYLGLLEYDPNMINTLQRIMPRMIDFETENSSSYELLKNNLIRRIQKNPNQTIYAQMLIWSLIQRKEFGAALIQAKALDKRTTKDGREVFMLGKIAKQNNDFEAARKAFKYVVEMGDDKPFYFAAEEELLNTRYLEITIKRNYSQELIQEAVSEYKSTLERIGKNRRAIPIIAELAYIQAYYGKAPTEAKKLLEEALEYPGSTDIQKAELKTALGDVLLLLGDIWEASLLYMQVEKDFKFEPIGYEAKFKNARIFYYDGDFTWAQSQLDVLKQSTTKLIANDAMNLSILITDNLGLDSNFIAMRQFAKADLLLQQHKYQEAFEKYDSIQGSFPYHGLADEILMRKAEAFQSQGKWEKAIELLLKVKNDFSDDILADDALFQLANIYENHLFQNDKASEYYFELMKKYPGSLFVTEARKRYRAIKEIL
ncbi:MAG: tetratricopeptide repeat protein [Brumimicrobium sp.]|nr:tetratricopeptide repeat protein [Brumimicrobium sp.]